MFHDVPEHTADRLVIRESWDPNRQAQRLVRAGVAFLGATAVSAYLIWGHNPLWVPTLVLVCGMTVGLSFLWRSRSPSRRLDEILYVFDKRSGTFAIRKRPLLNSTPVVESYQLSQVQGAELEVVNNDETSDNIVIHLTGAHEVRFGWPSFSPVPPKQLHQTINSFLGTP